VLAAFTFVGENGLFKEEVTVKIRAEKITTKRNLNFFNFPPLKNINSYFNHIIRESMNKAIINIIRRYLFY